MRAQRRRRAEGAGACSNEARPVCAGAALTHARHRFMYLGMNLNEYLRPFQLRNKVAKYELQ